MIIQVCEVFPRLPADTAQPIMASNNSSSPLNSLVITFLNDPHMLQPDSAVPVGGLGQGHHVVHQDLLASGNCFLRG